MNGSLAPTLTRPSALLPVLLLLLSIGCAAELVSPPYLQNLTAESVDLYWVETHRQPRKVNALGRVLESRSREAHELAFDPKEVADFPECADQKARFIHHCRLSGFAGMPLVEYSVNFADQKWKGSFRPAPGPRDAVHLVAFADSETEPESTGTHVKWATPEQPERKYLVDQTDGLRANLGQIASSAPDGILIAGDLVESGGEQRDWDEFWRQFGTLGGHIPLITAPGNHEYYAGPKQGQYAEQASRRAIAKYRAYFHPDDSDGSPMYYRKDIGLVSILAIDCVDGLPHRSPQDSNYYLEAAGDFAPDYHPGSAQGSWLEAQLADCQKNGRFTVVLLHHCPYSSGPHGVAAGTGKGQDPLSGQPARVLTPLFMHYGVQLLLCGHDEMFERSELRGTEQLPDGTRRPHTLQVYDVGVAGDGLRGPETENSYAKFLAYRDSPEVWKDGALLSGGRHYGHLDVRVRPTRKGWEATLTPVYILPLKTDKGWKFERRCYPDKLILKSR